MKKDNIVKIVKILISVILLSWVIYTGTKAGNVKIFASINIVYFIFACIFHLTAFMLLLIRWRLLIGIHTETTIFNLLPSYYIGIFSNNLLPGSVGGDFIRASYLYKSGINLNELLVCSLTDRLIGVIATIIIGMVAISFSTTVVINEYIDITFVFIFLFLCFIIPIGFSFYTTQILNLLSKINLPENWLLRIQNLAELLKALITKPLQLISAISCSFLSIISIVFCYYFLAESMGLNLNLLMLCMVVPVSFIISSIPISVGGLGIRESSIMFLLSVFHIPMERSSTLAILYLLVLLIVTTPGGLLIIKKQKNGPNH